MTKKNVSIILLAALLLTLPVPTANPVQAETRMAVIKKDQVNIRTGPGLSYPVKTTAKFGQTFPIVENKGDWVKVKLGNGSYGWIAEWLLSEEGTDFVVSSSNGLRIRSGPGTSYKVIGHFPKGEKAALIQNKGDWAKISYKKQMGWVSRAYISAANGGNHERKTGVVQAAILNIRSKPSTKSSVIGKLSKNVKIDIVEEKDGWLKIRYKQITGWAMSQYIKTSDSKTSPSAPQMGVVTASSLNVRNAPSFNSGKVGSIPSGTKVTIIGENGDWYKIHYGKNRTGWVSKRYVEVRSAQKGNVQRITLLYDGTNLRSAPSTSASIVQRGNKGDQFQVVNAEGSWYKIQLANGKTAYVANWIVAANTDSENRVLPSKGKKVIIDPGHGGYDSGTIGANGTLEKKATLKTAKLVYDQLKKAGVNVSLTRNDDTYISLSSRVGIAERNNAAAFVSIHYNSSIIQSAKGITTFYHRSSKDKKLATILHQELIRHSALRNRGVQYGNYYVLRENSRPSALLELGFLSNAREEWIINTKAYQEQVSKAISKGIVKYIKS